MKPIHIHNHAQLPIVSNQRKPNSLNGQNPSSRFTDHLQQAIKQTNRLTTSKHAEERMIERGIQLDEKSWNKLQEKVDEANRLGIKESLVLLKDSALIVSANNQKIITAMSRTEANEQIFTNITGTIVME